MSANPQALCDPSQNGLLAECPQRHKPIAVRPASPKRAPFWIHNLEVAFDADRSVVIHDDFGRNHFLSGTIGLRNCRGALYVRPCHKSNPIHKRNLDWRRPMRLLPPDELSVSARYFGTDSILRYGRIDLIGPGEDAAVRL